MTIKSLTTLHNFLVQKKIIKSLEKATIFYDEPQVHHVAAILDIPQTYHYKQQIGEVGASGISFDDPEEAILKCMYEAMERYSLIFWQEKIKRISLRNLHPAFTQNSVHFYNNVGTVSAVNLKTGEKTFVPAQSVYLSYYKPEEPFLSSLITTGAAGDSSLESATNRGLLEIVERDSFMTRYLISHWPQKINLDSIHDHKIRSIISYLRRYNLVPYIFDTTNDIGIPTFFSVLIDNTGIGPAISSGLSARFNANEAIQNALLETIITRWWIRKELMLNKIKGTIIEHPAVIQTVRDRAFYWSSNQMLTQLKPLLTQTAVPLINNQYKKITKSSELIKHLLSLGYTIFMKDITNILFKPLHCSIVRTIVPELQPLYLNETRRIIHEKRLEKVARFFDRKRFTLNTVPHPFL